MTNTDQSDDEVTEMVDEICKEYARRKYKTAVFMSGEHELEDSTEGLLCQNLGL